jgi:DNA-binding transcriptional LysR family regulator
LADIDTALEELNSFRNEPTGVLKLNVPRAAAPVVIAPLLARFAERYPAIRVEIAADDALVDVVGAGFDAGVRFSERVPRDMVAVRIGPDLRFAVIASPGYFEGRKKPRTPQDLRQHQCIRYRFPSGAHYRWEFEKNGQAIAVDVDGPLGLDDQELMTYAALGGAGLAFVFEQRAQPYLDSRQLVRVLEDWCPAFPGMFLYYPGRRQMPVPLRLFVDMLKEARR